MPDICIKDNTPLNRNYHLPKVYTCPKCYTEYVKTIDNKLMEKKEFLEKAEEFNG